MHQEPAGGLMVAKGTELYLTISMGKEPNVKLMEDLVGITQDRATSFLMGQGLKPLVREEASDDYPAGYVVHTDPAAGAELSDGQTVRLFVSTGPSTVTGKMPNLLGVMKERALEFLDQCGFQNVTVTGVYSTEEKGRVVTQSEKAGTTLDVNTHIILEISEGQEIETAVMPDVMKLDSATAIQALKSRGFATIETYEVKSDQPAGVVVRQTETAGSVVALSKEILLGVSNGADYKSRSFRHASGGNGDFQCARPDGSL